MGTHHSARPSDDPGDAVGDTGAHAEPDPGRPALGSDAATTHAPGIPSRAGLASGTRHRLHRRRPDRPGRGLLPEPWPLPQRNAPKRAGPRPPADGWHAHVHVGQLDEHVVHRRTARHPGRPRAVPDLPRHGGQQRTAAGRHGSRSRRPKRDGRPLRGAGVDRRGVPAGLPGADQFALARSDVRRRVVRARLRLRHQQLAHGR